MSLKPVDIADDAIQAKRFKCKCGKTRMIVVIDPLGRPPSKESLREQTILLKANLEVDIIPLKEAREQEFCFDCEL